MMREIHIRLASSVVLAVGLAVMGYFIGNGLHSLKPNTRNVSVRGLSEREVSADTAQLVILFSNTGRSPEKIFPALAATQKKVVAFLNSNGIKDGDITIGQWKTTRTSADDLKNDPSLPLFDLSGDITVTTHDVSAVEQAHAKLNDMRAATNGAVHRGVKSYSFNGLAPIRAEMIAAATKDARNAALQFAEDSGSRVGSISTASQGIFQVLGDDADIHKTVRVVTSVNYELK
ncbi:MAG: SIMPL domain-containing protein [Phycisphaerales bacterium]|nr:SIMPL domain-containing protein [Phycisphaerales bacterium]